jgi:hypothetical protein
VNEVPDAPQTLVDVLDRLLDCGVYAGGDLVISIAGVELIAVALDVVIASVEQASRWRGRPIGGPVA